MKTKTLFVGAVFALTLAAAAPVRADDAVKLARTYKAGESVRHKSVINASLMGMEVLVTETSKTTVKEIKPNGDVVLINAGEGAHVSIGGMEMDQPGGPPTTETRSKINRLVEYKNEDGGQSPFAPEIQHLQALLRDILLPEKAVKAGDTWTTEMNNPAVKDKQVAVKGTFVGIEKVDGVDLWKVKQTAEPDVEGGKMSYETTAWLDPKNGAMVKAEATVKDLPSQFGPLSMTVKVTLVKEEKKDAK